MATTAATPTFAPPTADSSYESTGLWSWIATVDHKRIGTLYLWTALFFFVEIGRAHV